MKKIIVTGSAGFIGFHLAQRLIKEKYFVIGIDNINSYYDKNLKFARLNYLEQLSLADKYNWKFFEADIENESYMKSIFNEHKPEIVIHLAAQAGVRHSLTNPREYINSNLVGFFNILENCKISDINHFIFASSSSVYGGNIKIPFEESDSVNHPLNIYAATKRSNELIAHSYSNLFKIPITGLRFFTVYGPWGRPDMAPMIFTKAIFTKTPIKVFNNGNMHRDFTYIDDVVESIMRLIDKSPQPRLISDNSNFNPAESWAPFQIFNIGNSNSIKLIDFINTLEEEIGEKAIKVFQPMQPGDIKKTYADTSLIEKITGFKPKTSLKFGVKQLINWYKTFYDVKNNN